MRNKHQHFYIAAVGICLLTAIFLCSCADLVVTNIHSETFTAAARIVKATVKNQGSKAAPASSTRVEATSTISGSTPQVFTISTPPLGSGEEKECYIGTDVGNCVHYKVCADSNDVVNEGWAGEGNNCSTKSISCP